MKTEMSVRLSVTFGGGMAEEKEGEQEGGGNGAGAFLHVWRKVAGETGRVDRKEGAMGRWDFTDGMPGWTYFSLTRPGHLGSTS